MYTDKLERLHVFVTKEMSQVANNTSDKDAVRILHTVNSILRGGQLDEEK